MYNTPHIASSEGNIKQWQNNSQIVDLLHIILIHDVSSQYTFLIIPQPAVVKKFQCN